MGRLVVAHHAGDQAGDGLDDRDGGHLAAGQHEVAERQLAVDQVVGDPLVDALVAAAEQREPRRGRPAPPPRPGRSAGRPARAAAAAGAGRTASTAANTGSGASTIPAPPPNGLSSTERCGSVVPARRSWTRRSSRPARAAFPIRLAVGPGRHQIRENGEHIDAQPAIHSGRSQLEQAGRQLDRQPARARGRRRSAAGSALRPARTSRSLAGLASTDSTTPIGRPGHVDHLGADQLVDPQGLGVRRAAAPQQGRPARASACSRVVDAAKRHQPPGADPPTSRCGLARTTSSSPAGPCSRAPGATRSSRLVHNSTTTWPRSPCGRATRPTSRKRQAVSRRCRQ